MRLIEYRPEHFEAVRRAVAPVQPHSALCHRPFVDYYYTSSEWARLFLMMGEGDQVAGTMGLEQLHFACGGNQFTFGMSTNYLALQPGAGGFLFMRWSTAFDTAIVLGATADVHRITRRRNWTYFPGLKTFHLNRIHRAEPGEAAWRVMAKWGLRTFTRPQPLARGLNRVRADLPPNIRVQEERALSPDLLPRRSPFTLRLAPPLEYLQWRYAPDLSFVRYRVFRLLRADDSIGYILLNEQPGRVLVAQADAEDAEALAAGMLLSLVAVTRNDPVPRECLLLSAHPGMQRIFRRFGFHVESQDRPFALAKPPPELAQNADASNWLVHFDWADIGLRRPFLDEAGGGPNSAEGAWPALPAGQQCA